MARTAKAEDLTMGQKVIDPEGNPATVIRIRRASHVLGWLELSTGEFDVALDEPFELLSSPSAS